MSRRFDEIAHAGPEHLDADFVGAFDERMPRDWSSDVATLLAFGVGPTSTVVDLGAGTGTFAQAIARHVSRVVAVDVSQAMVAAMRARGVQAVHAGFLSYEHEGEAPHAVFTSNAMHHLPDFWKMIALARVAGMLRPGGVLRLRDFVYSFEPHEADQVLAAWLEAELAQGWTAHELEEHILNEHSTFTWLLERMLERAGFEIRERSVREDRVHATYTCVLL
ncbi:MAG: methyltransferase domain-containing protein [Actinomycetota bacterium]|nr:methyltransferase domain-containing protein [Actinomycetota bacterium]